MADDADVIIVGAGLAGLVAAAELAEAGKRVIIVDQEPEQSLGGQAFWSLGGSLSRRFARAAAHAHPRFARSRARRLDGHRGLRPRRRISGRANGRRPMSPSPPARSAPGCAQRGLRFFPVVGWAERGGGNAIGHGNSVPRFHVTWGTGPGVLEPFVQRVREARKAGTGRLQVPPSRQRTDTDRRRRRRRARRHARAKQRRARPQEFARGRRRFRAAGAGGDRRLRRHRRQSSSWCARTGRSGWARRRSG